METAARGALQRGPIVVLYNPAAGSSNPQHVSAEIEGLLKAAGRDFEVITVSDPSALSDAAIACAMRASRSNGVVVAVGGDGTLNTIARAAIAAECEFGIVPMGTFNYFGRALGISSSVERAVEVLITGQVRRLQVGWVNDRLFLVNASLGLYPRLLEEREEAKRQFGRSRVVAIAVGLIGVCREYVRLNMRLKWEGQAEEVCTSTLFVGNNRLQLERVGLHEAASLRHGLLVGIYPRSTDLGSQVGLALRGSLGQLGDADQVTSFVFRELIVERASQRRGAGRRNRVKVATDGEVQWMALPLRFRVATDALAMICPSEEPSAHAG